MQNIQTKRPDKDALQASLPEAVKARIEKNAKRQEFWNKISQPIDLYLGGDRLKLALGESRAANRSRELQEELLFLEQQPKFIKAVESENQLDGLSAAQVRTSGDLGDRPLIVLTAGEPDAGDPDDNVLSLDQKKARDNLWIYQLQAQYARLSSHGKQLVVQRSSHNMPTDRPDAIVSAVREVCSEINK